MERNKWVINTLLLIIMILVIVACVAIYMCFTNDVQIIELSKSEEEKLFSEEDYPKIDGSMATVLLAEAFKANFTNTDINEVEVIHSKTHDAYVNLINGDTDLILVPYPSEEEQKLAKDNKVELEIVPIVKDAFVFFVNENNLVDNLTLEQIQGIYSGEINKWNEVGGINEKIFAYQRPKNTHSQSGMLELVMKDNKIREPIIENITQNGTEIKDVISDYKNENTSIGYSFSSYYKIMYSADSMKLLSVNGIKPTYENVQTGLYNLQTVYYAVIRKDEESDSNTRRLLEAMKSERGQNVAKEAGYVQNY